MPLLADKHLRFPPTGKRFQTSGKAVSYIKTGLALDLTGPATEAGVPDKSAYGNDAVLNSGWVAVLDGVDDFGTVPHHADFDLAGREVVIGVWIRVSALAGFPSVIVAKGGFDEGWFVGLYSNGKLRWSAKQVGSGASYHFAELNAVLAVNTWHTFKLTVNGGELISAEVNGSPVAITEITAVEGTYGDSPKALTVGCRNGGESDQLFFAGDISYLSFREVGAALPFAQYLFDEHADAADAGLNGLPYFDSSGNGHHGTCTGGSAEISEPGIGQTMLRDWNRCGFVQSAAHGMEDGAFLGATTVGDYAVFAALNADNFMAWNPVTNTLVTSAAHGMGDGAFFGATTLGDYAVFAARNADNFMAWNPVTNTLVTSAAHGMGDDAFFGATTLGDYAVFAAYNADNFMAWNPVTNTLVTSAAHGMGAGAFRDPVTLGDYAVFTARDADNFMAWNPVTNTLVTSAAHGMEDGAFIGATALGDYAVFAAYNADNFMAWSFKKGVSGLIYLPASLANPGQDVLGNDIARPRGDLLNNRGVGDNLTVADSASLEAVKTVMLVIDHDGTDWTFRDLGPSSTFGVSGGNLTSTGITSPTYWVDGVETAVLTEGRHVVAVTSATAFDCGPTVGEQGLTGKDLFYSTVLSESEIKRNTRVLK